MKPSKTPGSKASFEDSFKQLESLVQEFEQGDLDLEKGLEKFKTALQLAKTCKERLAEVENKVEVIKKDFAEFNTPQPSTS